MGRQDTPDSPDCSLVPQEAWLSSSSLQTAFQANHSTKLGPGEGSKAKRRALMLHSDPSILGYSLHGPSGEIESVDDY